MRALILNDEITARIKAQTDWANQPENWYRPEKDKEPPGDNPAYTMMLEVGFRVVYSMTAMKGQRFRHLSISVQGSRYPNEYAAFTIATMFGFTGGVAERDVTTQPGKDWMIDGNPQEHCIVMAQRIIEPLEPLKPWPSDAVMIVCEYLGRENRANMESVVEVECRDCQAKLGADSKTIRLAEEAPVRRGRPVKFFCVACFIKHERSSITHYADHSAAHDGGPAILAANPKAVDLEGK